MDPSPPPEPPEVTPTPLITTIIPTYRRPAMVRRAIASALSQSVRSLRVCVYDNASGDGTAEMVVALARDDPRLQYHCHASNLGSIANINHGLRHVTTPYFSLLSDDDVLLPSFYETALEVLKRHPDAAFAAGQVIEITEHGRVVKVVPPVSAPEERRTPPESLFSILSGRHPTLTGALFQSWVLKECGDFDGAVALGDLDFYMRITSRHPFVVFARPVGLFVSHPGSFTRQFDLAQIWDEHGRVVERLERDPAIPSDVRSAASEIMRRYLVDAVFRMGVRAVAEGAFDSAQEAMSILERRHDRRARVLDWAGRFGRRAPRGRRFLMAGYACARALRWGLRPWMLQRRYGRYARFLRPPDAARP